MNDRPIIFSAPMIRALLEGRKTQTRRILKPQPAQDGDMWFWGDFAFCDKSFPISSGQEIARKVRFAPSDRLWVRENWSHSRDGVWSISDARLCGPSGALYAADGHEHAKWFPSIHMPREFSRLTLIVESVKVERLQDISQDDAIAEGVERISDCEGVERYRHYQCDSLAIPYEGCAAKLSFSTLWDSIHGDGAWDSNPWVAAISFRVVKTNIDTIANTPICEAVSP